MVLRMNKTIDEMTLKELVEFSKDSRLREVFGTDDWILKQVQEEYIEHGIEFDETYIRGLIKKGTYDDYFNVSNYHLTKLITLKLHR